MSMSILTESEVHYRTGSAVSGYVLQPWACPIQKQLWWANGIPHPPSADQDLVG